MSGIEKRNNEEIGLLIAYLNALSSVSKTDVKVFAEIKNTIEKIEEKLNERGE